MSSGGVGHGDLTGKGRTGNVPRQLRAHPLPKHDYRCTQDDRQPPPIPHSRVPPDRTQRLWYTFLVSLIEAIPNISEGKRTGVIEAFTVAVCSPADVELLNQSSDAAHNRTVFTLVGTPAGLTNALVALYDVALRNIDLKTHRGEHPRIGAVDVVPLVPLAPRDMPLCVTTATALAETIASQFDVPVYLYADAATRQNRHRLEQIRSGEFEGLSSKMSQPAWRPDFGPTSPHPSAGASVIGARRPLVAFNVNLETGDLNIAKRIARTVRESSGGLPAVKAIGIRTRDPSVVQISINLVDYRRTPLHVVFDAVRDEASRLGTNVRSSELIGLAPAEALHAAATHRLHLEGVTTNQVLEYRLRHCPDPKRPQPNDKNET